MPEFVIIVGRFAYRPVTKLLKTHTRKSGPTTICQAGLLTIEGAGEYEDTGEIVGLS